MIWAIVILSVATVAAGILAAASRRKAAQLSLQLRRLMPFVIKTGVDPSVIAQAAPGCGSQEFMNGGDTSPRDRWPYPMLPVSKRVRPRNQPERSQRGPR